MNNATFNNISVKSWWSILLMPGEMVVTRETTDPYYIYTILMCDFSAG
jgi:hypothetical protein